MKKQTVVILGLGLLVSVCLSTAQAADSKSDSKIEKKLAENQAKRKAELKDTEWKVTFYSNKPTDKDAENGSLVFSAETMTFNGFNKVDLGTIGYTLTAYADNDKGMLETYKPTKDGNISLRADWQGQIMNGVISEQKNGGKDVKTYRFTSVNQVSPLANQDESKKESLEAAAPVDAALPVMASTEKAVEKSEKKKR